MKSRFILLWLGLCLSSLHPAAAAEARTGIEVRFTDSATGQAVEPAEVWARPQQPGLTGRRLERGEIGRGGRVTLDLSPGSYVIAANSPDHLPMSGAFEMDAANPFKLEFHLDPVAPPREIAPEYVMTLWRKDETVFVGYVVDEGSGRPLAGVRVRAEPAGAETSTDERGYFQIYVPVQTLAEAQSTPASLRFAKPGYTAEVRRYLELWSEGDWTYRIRLERGGGTKVVDERQHRRRSRYPITSRDDGAQVPSPNVPESLVLTGTVAKAGDGGPGPLSASTTAIVRVPTNIRVLRSDAVTIDVVSLETYCRRSLNDEWIPSWNNYTGGSNSLRAGAVANRTYAVGYFNSPASPTYDICGTTSCQVYDTDTTSSTDTAVNGTTGYVMFKPGDARVGFKLTEYSSENNQFGMACGDGYTAPTGSCLYDPVCAGEPEFGHGRGMCQWGTVKWATGLKFPGNDFSNTSLTNGFSRQDWIWICEHYFPQLVLAQGTPLAVGDDVKVLGTASLAVRQCPGNTITNGINCAQVASKASGSIGTILGGPVLVTGDGGGFTWWQVDWGDTNGWCVENYLERVSAVPAAPGPLTATAISPTQINLAWGDNAANEMGTFIERAPAAGGPWTTNQVLRAGLNAWADTNVSPAATYHYRVRQFNQSALSAYSNVTNATTPGVGPVLAAISNRTVVEGTLLTFTNTATTADLETELTDFEGYGTGVEVLFQEPRFSGSTSALLSNTPNVTLTTAAFPSGQPGARVLNVNWAFTNSAANPWLRLTTSGTGTLPNPVIDFTRWLRFRIWSDRPLRVGLGLRETTNAPGTPIGSNGGTSGGIEWVGITNSISGQPQPSRQIAASNWTTIEFNLPAEPVRNFVNGNGALSTASGLGTLEHLALVPVAGNLTYNIYLDDFAVFTPNQLTYSLEPGAPTNAAVDGLTGVFAWTPTEAQGPGDYLITVRVTDSGVPPQSDTEGFTVTVNETNAAPTLAAIANLIVHAGAAVTFTNTAADPDLPANTLSFSLDPGAPPTAGVGTSSGVFSWLTTDADAGLAANITVRVTDNGVPALSDTESFTVTVQPRPAVQSAGIAGGSFALTWSAIPGAKYRVQFKNQLEETNWTDLSSEVTAGGATADFNDPLGLSQRYYRVRVVTP